MRAYLRIVLLTVCKWLGGFAAARLLTARGLRILCYHGVSTKDEHLFRPPLFITPEAFRDRIKWLKRANYPVLTIADAVDRLEAGILPRFATVITFDDGWYSSLIAASELKSHSLRATFYITSYYVLKQEPIFNLFVAYAIWRTGKAAIMIDDREQTQPEITRDGAALGTAGRLLMMRRISEAAGISFDEILTGRYFGLMNEKELSGLVADGFDIQLHTHRHHVSGAEDQLRKEINDNRGALEPILGRRPEHFCYPSGRYFEAADRILSAEGIKSATTVIPGLNYRPANLFALRRILDSVVVSQIEFEAEMSGFLDLIRAVRRRVTSLAGASNTTQKH